MTRITAIATLVAAGVLGGAVPSHAQSPPTLPPLPPTSAFGTGTVNPFFPLVPGTTAVFAGRIDGVAAYETYTVTTAVKLIDGIPTNVVRDRLYLEREQGDGRYLAEDTVDWYATDASGTVWYFGEDTAEYDEDGTLVSTDGSWQDGVDGARAGVVMPAVPEEGDAYRQESAPGARDLFRIVRIADDTLTAREWTPLEPGLVTEKVYAAGVGMVLEDTVKGASIEDLRLQLVDVRHA